MKTLIQKLHKTPILKYLIDSEQPIETKLKILDSFSALALVIITLIYVILTGIIVTTTSNQSARMEEQIKIIAEQSKATKNMAAIMINKEGVNLRPVININSIMYKNNQLGAPKIIITNNGKVEAINVIVQIVRRQFDGEKFVGASWGGSTDNQHIFDKIITLESKEILLPERYIVNPEYNTIELRIHYMRDYDKQVYSYRTFYFYRPIDNEFGSWDNIQQAKISKSYSDSKIIEEALKLPKNLYDDNYRIMTDDGLYELK